MVLLIPLKILSLLSVPNLWKAVILLIIVRPWFNLIMIWGLDWTIVWEFQLVYPHWNEGIKASATSSGSYRFVHITDPFLPCMTCCSELLSRSTSSLDLVPLWLACHNLDEFASVTVGKWIASAARSIGATIISPTAVNGSLSHLCTEIDVRTKTLGSNCWIGKLMYWFILWVSVFWCRIRVVLFASPFDTSRVNVCFKQHLQLISWKNLERESALMF